MSSCTECHKDGHFSVNCPRLSKPIPNKDGLEPFFPEALRETLELYEHYIGIAKDATIFRAIVELHRKYEQEAIAQAETRGAIDALNSLHMRVITSSHPFFNDMETVEHAAWVKPLIDDSIAELKKGTTE